MIRAVIFDWAGTTIDYGNQAPAIALRKTFKQFGIEVNLSDFSCDGTDPLIQIKRLMATEKCQKEWYIAHPDLSLETGVAQLNRWFNRNILEILPQIAEVKSGMPALISYFRTQGIRFATTTRYTREMLTQILPLASEQGFDPAVNVTADEFEDAVYPGIEMIKQAMAKLRIRNAESVIKVGDTPRDIFEGKAAGVMTIGMVEGSSLIGLSQSEFSALPFARRNSLKNQATAELERAGADYVVENAKDLMRLIKELDTEKAIS